MTPQVSASLWRGLAETLIVAAATGGEYAVAHLLTGDTTRAVVIGAVGAACNFILARAGEGKLDANRAAAVAKGDLRALHKADVGFVAAKEHLERCIVARPPE